MLIHIMCGKYMPRVFFLVIFSGTLLIAQDTTPKPCAQSQARQFDFWIGDWEAEWTSNEGEIKKGRNSVRGILGECVIFEEFDGRPGNMLIGKSVSVFDPKSGKWKQTWVDNSGGYLDFSGGFKDNKMALSREIQTPEGKRMQRMVWYNIGPDQFDWNWEISDNDGGTWRVAWQIHYSRL